MNEQQRKAYQEKIRAQMDQWNAEIDKRRAKLRETSADARLEAIDRFERLRSDAEQRLEALQRAGEAGWDEARRRVDDVLDRARAAYDAARSG